MDGLDPPLAPNRRLTILVLDPPKSSEGCRVCLFSFIYNPLHAARRDMAAACRCLEDNGVLFYMTFSCPKPHCQPRTP